MLTRALFVLLLLSAALRARAQASVEAERSTLPTSPLLAERALAGRLVFAYRIHPRHEVRFVKAPFRFKSHEGTYTIERYNGDTFGMGMPVATPYRISSYRFTYRYSAVRSQRAEAQVGVTMKAGTALLRNGPRQSAASRYVPMLHGRVRVRPLPQIPVYALAEADFAAQDGRLEDVLAALEVRTTRRLFVYAGVRRMDAGAEVNGQHLPGYTYGVVGLRKRL